MSIGLYPCRSAAFVAEHGAEGARRYLRLARQGLMLQRELGAAVLADPATQLQQRGSLYVCENRAEDIAALWAEFRALRELGYEACEWWGDTQRVRAAAGGEWARGIWFPDDCVINSTAYAAGLLEAARRRAPGALVVRSRCSPVVAVETVRGRARTTLASGEELWSEHVVLAAGGLFVDHALAGVLRPAWSYLVGIMQPATGGPAPAHGAESGAFRFAGAYSPNMFSWGFTHDWCLSGGVLRCSGEDHHSALKPPRAEERCEALAEWTAQQYPYLRPAKASCERRYGVYSQTPDHAPVVGSTRPGSRVCYLQVSCAA
jgi:glycine/D-amino acid oxidase-like deaminating enzyme